MREFYPLYTDNPSLFNGRARNDFNYNFPNQMIKAEPDKRVIDGFRALKDQLAGQYPNLNIENIAIQTADSIFNLEPFIRL